MAKCVCINVERLTSHAILRDSMQRCFSICISYYYILVLFPVAITWTNLSLVAFLCGNIVTGRVEVGHYHLLSEFEWLAPSQQFKGCVLPWIYITITSTYYAYCYDCVMFRDALLKLCYSPRSNSASTELWFREHDEGLLVYELKRLTHSMFRLKFYCIYTTTYECRWKHIGWQVKNIW